MPHIDIGQPDLSRLSVTRDAESTEAGSGLVNGYSLAVGIIATLAANMAQGWSHGPVGAVIAAWPAVSLVGSYELLVWIIRTAAAGGPDHGPAAARKDWYADHLGADLGSGHGDMGGPGPKNRLAQAGLVPASMGGPEFPARAKGSGPGTRTGEGSGGPPVRRRGPETSRLRRCSR
jgi:hypothetical protein